MNGGGGDRHRRGQLAPIDNEGKCSNNVSQRSCEFAYKFYLFGQTTDFCENFQCRPSTPPSPLLLRPMSLATSISVAAVRLTTNRLHKTGYAVHHGFHNLT
jgi:hypothetical protein